MVDSGGGNKKQKQNNLEIKIVASVPMDDKRSEK